MNRKSLKSVYLTVFAGLIVVLLAGCTNSSLDEPIDMWNENITEEEPINANKKAGKIEVSLTNESEKTNNPLKTEKNPDPILINSEKFGTGSFAEDGIAYQGNAYVTGYPIIIELPEGFCDQDCTVYKYVFFELLEASNKNLIEFINLNKGNTFVGTKSVGLGCAIDDLIYFRHQKNPEGIDRTRLTKELSDDILKATENNPISIELGIFLGPIIHEGEAPDCYSHFTKISAIQ